LTLEREDAGKKEDNSNSGRGYEINPGCLRVGWAMQLDSSHFVIAPAFSFFVQRGGKAYRKTASQIRATDFDPASRVL